MTDSRQRMINMLKDWAEWMQHDDLHIGYPKRVPMLACGGGSPTFEELLDHVDGATMKAVDSGVSSLPPGNRAAIYRCYGVCAVWRFQREKYTYISALEDAHDMLEIIIRRKLAI